MPPIKVPAKNRQRKVRTSLDRLRVLLIAEAANPEWTSVPLVGWSHAMALRELVDGHIVTQVRNRDAFLRAGLIENKDFTAIDSERVAMPMWKLAALIRGGNQVGWTTMQAFAPISYYYFERLLWKQFGERIKSHQFDLVHRLTPLSPTTPSIIAKRCMRAGVPFLLGPLNGGVPWPKWFQKERRKEKEWLAPIRGAYRLLPGYRSTLKYSAAILVGSRDTMRQLPSAYAGKTHYITDNGIDPTRFGQPRHRQPALPLQLLFVGRLVPYKGADMAIEAAEPLLADGRAELTIVGDGPERKRLHELAARSAKPSAIRFTGEIPHKQIGEHFSAADLFVFPSIREFGGAVVLEAMTMGAVPIIVNYGGPAEFVTEEAGYCLDVGPRRQIVKSLRDTLEKIAANPSVLLQKITAGQQRVKSEFTWQTKAKQVVEIYRQVLRS
jgi:glycosyltransferase involved in cell wall biosynthesis